MNKDFIGKLDILIKDFEEQIKSYEPKDYYDCYTWGLEYALKKIKKLKESL